MMFRCLALLNVSTFSSSLCGPTLQILEAPEIRKNTQEFNPLLLKGTISRAIVGRVFNFCETSPTFNYGPQKVKETHISHTSHFFFTIAVAFTSFLSSPKRQFRLLSTRSIREREGKSTYFVLFVSHLQFQVCFPFGKSR